MKIDVIVTSFNEKNFKSDFLNQTLQCDEINYSPLCFVQKSSDDQKIENLKAALTSQSDVILALKGGAGCPRLMPEIMKLPAPSKPKIFVGYSDLTVLLNHFNKFDNMQLIHGTMASKIEDQLSVDKFQAALRKEDVSFAKEAKWLIKKPLNGEVIGGNMLVLVHMIGTCYEPDFTDKILLIEEIDEELTKIDRMFTVLRDSGNLAKLRGVILGQFTDCEDEEGQLEIFKHYLEQLGIGVLYDVNLGHVKHSDYIHLHTPLSIDEKGIKY